MSQSARTSSIVNRTDGTNPSTKQSLDSLRPHYYTTFQNYCCGAKANTTTTTTQNKDLLPIPQKFKDDAEKLINVINEVLIENLAKVTKYTSIIPNIFFEKNDNFQIQKYLIDRVMFRTLKEADIINWMPNLKTLYPIRTSGNGNCLLHAVLIAMIGIHDSNLYLRDRLAQFMNDNKDLLKTHWRIERLKSDKSYGISSEDAELDDEWKELCDIVHYENSEDGQAATHLQFLEAVHIFSISNMLHRPIIVLSEDVIRNKNGEAISVNDLFGIYLPILSSPNECINEPIVLAYDRSHFCPLQTTDIINRDKILDNLLPLYPSINHILDQKLLPIRFLGDDTTVEHSNNLLHEYLRIQKVDYNLDPSSPSISVLCAELGSKYLSLKENFFLLYHNYAKDFFEIQKPNAIEEERKRELDEYISRHTSYDTYGRSIVKRDTSPSKSPRSNNTMSDIQSYTQNNHSYGQRHLYDDVHHNEAYIPPRSSTFYIENSSFQPKPSQILPDYTKATQRDQNVDHTNSETLKPLYPTSNPDNIINLKNNGKMINSVNINVKGNDSRVNPERQQLNSTQIPVQVTKSDTSSNNQNLTIYEPRHVHRDKCLLCDHLFDDVLLKRICSDCDDRIRNATPYNDVVSRPNTRSRSTNLYLPDYDRSYTPTLSPRPKTRPLRKVLCPHCKCVNVLYNQSSSSDFHCSACQNPIPSSYRY